MSDERERQAAGRQQGIALAALRDDARAMTAAEFCERHAEAFLVHSDGHLEGPGGPGATVLRFETWSDGSQPGSKAADSIVHPIRRTGRSVGHLVSAGRTPNNDVVIPDASVSRFHAFFKQQPDGRFLVQDAGSTNGTEVNCQPIPAQGEGAPVMLESGDSVTIGQVRLRFFEAATLHELLAATD